ncbi:MAG TPA: matrixin family metalloprotease [Gemmatimonadaceae bacterium]|nr:matrixin family metalloprotease [Gemmatimonadaceae bacterium]
MARQKTSWFAQLITGCVAIVAALGLTGWGTVPGASSAGIAAIMDEPAPLRADVLRAASGTYIGRVLLERDSMLSRWPARVAEPIRVWVEPIGNAGFTDRVRDAFGEWTAIGLPLRFVFVERARDAEIQVRWTDRLERKTGNTVWRVDRNGWMRGGEVLLATHLGDGRPLDARSLRAIALHEIGHAIGLAHSDDRHDVMAPLVRVATLSKGDRATARLLYTLPAGHLR